MKGNKIVFILLIVVAIPLYIYDALLLIGKVGGKNQTVTEVIKESDLSIDAIKIVRFVKKGKSPLVAYKVKPKPVVKKQKKKVVKRKPKAAVKPPRIKITGIMWNPSNPIAMLTLPDGSSTTATKGQTLMGAITVKKISQSSVDVEYKGTTFTIRK